MGKNQFWQFYLKFILIKDLDQMSRYQLLKSSIKCLHLLLYSSTESMVNHQPKSTRNFM